MALACIHTISETIRDRFTNKARHILEILYRRFKNGYLPTYLLLAIVIIYNWNLVIDSET